MMMRHKSPMMMMRPRLLMMIRPRSQKVKFGLLASIERRWLDYEDDKIYFIYTLLDPKFKEVCFTGTALVRAKRLLLSIMRQGDPVTSSESVVNDVENNQEDVAIKRKKCLWNSFDKELEKKKSTDLSASQDKYEKNCHCTAVLNTLTERKIL